MTINIHNDDNLWRDLIEKTLQYALFDGLCEQSLLRSATDLNIPRIVVQARIQNVKVDVPRIWWGFLDADIYVYADTLSPNCRIRDKIARMVKHRILSQMAPYKPVVRDMFAQFALPQNAGFATRHMWDTAHHMWVAIDDTTDISDHNYYTKRLILAGVIFSGVCFWLQDDNGDETDAYIDRRIEDALRLAKAKTPKDLTKFSEYMPFMNHPLKMRD